MEDILKAVLERVRPTKEEEERLERVRKRVLQMLEGVKGSFVEVVFAGSTARGTHLRGSSDIDVFLLYEKDVPMEQIEEEIKRIAEALGGTLLYAQHPYMKLEIEGVNVEIVPAYKIRPGEPIRSATDRTPLHTAYVKSKLREEQKDEVRLLKAFMKGIGVYGAEIKVEGFSGYLCELLIIYYGSFLNVLRAASHWKWGEVIDIEGKGQVREKRPLIVVDPVDPRRNVAHSVSKDSMALFIIAARSFLKSPSLRFFFPREPRLEPREIKSIMEERRSRPVLVAVRYPSGEAPDNVWGQLKKFGRRLATKISARDNIVLQWDVWTDESDLVIVLMEVVGRYTARIHIREGPPVTNYEHSERFLEKHRYDRYGPYIRDGRLVGFYLVEEKSLLIEVFESVEEIRREKSIGGGLGRSLEEWVEVLEGRDVLRYYEKAPTFFSHFFMRKFPWEY